MCIVICTLLLSRPARGAWVEILILIDEIGVLQSRPARGAWVEILTQCWGLGYVVVAPRKGRVG